MAILLSGIQPVYVESIPEFLTQREGGPVAYEQLHHTDGRAFESRWLLTPNNNKSQDDVKSDWLYGVDRTKP